ALAFAMRRDPTLSRMTAAISFVTVLMCVLIERLILFRWEIHLARHRDSSRRVLILGTDSVAAHLQTAILREPRLRSRVIGFLRTQPADPDEKITGESVLGAAGDLKKILDEQHVDQVILTDSSIGHPAMIEIILLCEKAMVTFNLVPDLLYVLTGSVDIQTIAGIPLLGVSRWPLDSLWNRLLKRAEDIVGALLGLLLASLPMLVIAGLIRRASPGPVLFRQERCGQNRRVFILYKFRTMEVDADTGRKPGWTVQNDPRCTGIGAILRRNNLDELPQLWNVLKGEMSLVGPRPERPVFVDQFKEDIERYMWRHVCKPGLTGWAQVNGLRGNTDIRERLKHDLYYLENWSLAFDFKILVKTLFARKNAY
ncbi:MAG: exopolysaccharide biosynthesis polyprenyl glycosylphosphotransferase, partial [Lentisphaerae bacterium]|nr:exopolysaccharide biosynthesis polyprenyl glycosylphosphotransferase [Lentisphaerota bacterium]